MLFYRRKSVPVECGSVTIGGDAPVSIQTMTKCDTRNVVATVKEIQEAVQLGADIVRVAIVDIEAAQALSRIKKNVSCPIVADIHFDYRLALLAIDNGADKIRINPGNIGGKDRVLQVAKKAREKGVAIRIGVNSGSLEKDIMAKYGSPVPQALVESALRHIEYLERNGVDGIVVSLKSSSVKDTIGAYVLMAERTHWPFHIGVTEAGPGRKGIVKSATGLGALLAMGIGDTIRVSLTSPSRDEVIAAREILQSLEIRLYGPEIISCPTCGRTQVDVVPIAKKVSEAVRDIKVPIKIAVMGCPVNGPGEAKGAHVGVACGRDGGILFSRGKVIGRVSSGQIVDALLSLVREEAKRFRRE